MTTTETEGGALSPPDFHAIAKKLDAIAAQIMADGLMLSGIARNAVLDHRHGYLLAKLRTYVNDRRAYAIEEVAAILSALHAAQPADVQEKRDRHVREREARRAKAKEIGERERREREARGPEPQETGPIPTAAGNVVTLFPAR